MFGKKKEEVLDNREDYLIGKNGHPIAVEYTGAYIKGDDYNTGNHEDVLHDGTPHRDPVISLSRNPITFIVHGEVERRRYPVTVSSDGRCVNLEAITAYISGFNSFKNSRNGRTCSIVELNTKEIRKLETQEDKVQMARGVKRRNLRRSGTQSIEKLNLK